MAKFASRTDTTERIDVGRNSPLAAPLTILVEPASVCSLKCTFCPTGDFELSKSTGKFQGFIKQDLFEKIIDDVKSAGWKVKALHLQKDGEPLLHPKFTSLCRIARNSDCFEKIETTTNATLLHKYDLNDLVTCGLSRIKISLYGLSDEDFTKNCRTNINYDRLRESIKSLYLLSKKNNGPEIYIKIMAGKTSDSNAKKFLEDYSNICDTYHIEYPVNLWPQSSDIPSLSDTNVTEHDMFGNTVPKKRKVVCPQPFYQISITSDGKVLACCPDWQCKNLISDVSVNSLKDIWESSELRNFQLMMLRGERFDHPVCKNCEYPEYACVDNLDPYRSQILSRLNK